MTKKVTQVYDKFKKQFPTFLVLCIAVCASGLSTFFTYTYADESINGLTSQLMYEVTREVKQEIQNKIDNAILPTKTLKRVLELNRFNISYGQQQDLPEAMKYLYDTIVSSSLIGIFYLSNLSETNVGYSSNQNGYFGFFLFPGVNTQPGIYICDNEGRYNWTHDQPIAQVPPTSVRDFPAFVEARRTGVAAWSSPLVLAGFDELVYARLEPIYWKSGGLCGGLGINIGVKEWDTFLKTINVTTHSIVYIIDDSGILLADAQARSNDTIYAAAATSAVNSTNDLIASSAEYLLERYLQFNLIPQEDKIIYRGDKEAIMTARLNVAPTLKLIVVVVIPLKDVLGRVLKAKTIAISLTVCALVLGAFKYIPIISIYQTLKNRKRHLNTPVQKVEVTAIQEL